MAIRRHKIPVTPTAGGAGTSTLTANSGIALHGLAYALYIEYLDSPPNTTDVTVQGATAPKVPIITVSNANTNGWFYPMAQAANQSNTAITGQGIPIAIDDIVEVVVAQANDGDGVNVYLLYDDLK